LMDEFETVGKGKQQEQPFMFLFPQRGGNISSCQKQASWHILQVIGE